MVKPAPGSSGGLVAERERRETILALLEGWRVWDGPLLLATHGLPKVEAWVDYIRRALTVNNRGAYLRRALEDGWPPHDIYGRRRGS